MIFFFLLLLFYLRSLAIFDGFLLNWSGKLAEWIFQPCYVCDFASLFFKGENKGVVSGGDIFLQEKKDRTTLQAEWERET